MVYGFVKQAGGHVTIYSEVGLGTTINLYLPRAEKGCLRRMASAQRKLTPIRGRARPVLVVEDDVRVRQLTVRRLKLIGYQVLEAPDGPSALEVLRRGDKVDLVFTDLIMPGGLSGREVAIRAREMKPGIKSSAHLGICRGAYARR